MSNLTLSYLETEGEDFGVLCASVETADFSGRGRACVQWHDVEAFAANLLAYSLLDEPPVLRCGFNEGQGDDLIVSVEVKPADSRGGLTVSVEIADHVKPTRRVRADFRSHYSELAAFQNALMQKGRGEVEEAVLAGE